MATMLKICQDVARECGIAGTGPITVAGQTGELGDVVRWVVDSWEEIQNRRNARWRWLRHDFTLSVMPSDDTYASERAVDVQFALPISRFNSWRLNDRDDPPKIFPQGGNSQQQQWMVFADWSAWKTIYRIGQQNPAKPVHITVDPRDNLVIGPAPHSDLYFVSGATEIAIGETITGSDSGATVVVTAVTLQSGAWATNDAAGFISTGAVVGTFNDEEALTGDLGGVAVATYSHQIEGEYWLSPQILAADSDVPEMPVQYHNLIRWYAIENYGYKEAAPEVLARAQLKLKTFMRQLENNQMAAFKTAGPMA